MGIFKNREFRYGISKYNQITDINSDNWIYDVERIFKGVLYGESSKPVHAVFSKPRTISQFLAERDFEDRKKPADSFSSDPKLLVHPVGYLGESKDGFSVNEYIVWSHLTMDELFEFTYAYYSQFRELENRAQENKDVILETALG